MHRDHVPSVPAGFHLLGSTETCLVQGMLRPSSPATATTRPDSATDIHVLTVQGHPEFLPSIVNKVVDVREKSGAMDQKTVEMGRRQAGLEDDGVGVFGKVMWRILGVV
jgi:GMP synthase-like glutamine amidotransferase